MKIPVALALFAGLFVGCTSSSEDSSEISLKFTVLESINTVQHSPREIGFWTTGNGVIDGYMKFYGGERYELWVNQDTLLVFDGQAGDKPPVLYSKCDVTGGSGTITKPPSTVQVTGFIKGGAWDFTSPLAPRLQVHIDTNLYYEGKRVDLISTLFEGEVKITCSR